MYVCMYEYIAVSTRTLTPLTTGPDRTLKGTCWCKPRSQPSSATTRAISPKGNGQATKPATSAAGPPNPATARRVGQQMQHYNQ